jgi:glycosyltransferase involved in cell wall biosynthesis
MKIVFVAPSLQLGGMERASSLMADYFFSNDIDVIFITLYNFPHFYTLNPKIKIIDPQIDKSKEIKIIYYIKLVFFLRKQFKNIHPDRIVSYGDWTNMLIILASINLNLRIFISDRASPGIRFNSFVSILRWFLYKRAYGIIAQTDRAAMQKRKMLGPNINIKVIPNPIKPIILYPEITRSNYILGIGRHWSVKGLDRLITAFSFLKNHDYKLLIAGSKGPSSKHLENLVLKLDLEKKVVFLGSISNIDQLAATCKIFVLSSYSEGFPNALIESMAAGLACISFDIIAGPKEIITHFEDGLLVEDGNIVDLTNQIQYLIDNENEIKRLGSNAMKIKERLSIKKIGQQYIDFILS